MKRALLLCLVLTGCAEEPFPQEQPENLVAVVFDMSGSNKQMMAGIAFDHFSRTKDTLFRDMIGTENRIIISQINGSAEPILFEGSTTAFQRRFPTRQAFLDLLNQSPSGTSPVYRSCADTFDRVRRRHSGNPSLRSMVLIYSDMLDNHGGQERMDAAGRELSKFPCALGLYGCNEDWADYFTQLGFKHCVAFDNRRVDPPLPQLQ